MIRELLQFQRVFVDGKGYAGIASAVHVPALHWEPSEIDALPVEGLLDSYEVGKAMLKAEAGCFVTLILPQ